MRKGLCFMALLAAFSGADAVGPNDSCDNEAKVVCRIKVTVNTAVSPCRASVPPVIVVKRNQDGHPTMLLFYIRNEDPDVTFEVDGVTIVRNINGAGAPVSAHFDAGVRQGRRVFLVLNKNPSGNEKFEYVVKVKKGADACDPFDPLIHNTN